MSNLGVMTDALAPVQTCLSGVPRLHLGGTFDALLMVQRFFFASTLATTLARCNCLEVDGSQSPELLATSDEPAELESDAGAIDMSGVGIESWVLCG